MEMDDVVGATDPTWCFAWRGGDDSTRTEGVMNLGDLCGKKQAGYRSTVSICYQPSAGHITCNSPSTDSTSYRVRSPSRQKRRSIAALPILSRRMVMSGNHFGRTGLTISCFF